MATIVFKCDTCTNDKQQTSLVTSPICPTTSNTIVPPTTDNNCLSRPNPYNQCSTSVCFLGGNSPHLKKSSSTSYTNYMCESVPVSSTSTTSSSSSSSSNIIPTDTNMMTTDDDNAQPIDSEQCHLSTNDKQQYEIKTQRCLLFNKIVDLLPDNMVQPKGNLSDFVLI